jgi:riboflavin biosynthesis pyrimidine reductase
MRQLLPTPVESVDLRAAYAYPPDLAGFGRPWVRANMVSSLDGAAAVDGRSGALGGPGDKAVFGVLRGLADAVLVGAGTARVEGYRALRATDAYGSLRASLGQESAPVLVLVSGRLDLDPESALFHGGVQRTIVVTHASSDPVLRDRLSVVAEVIVAGDTSVDIGAALDGLAGRGMVRVLCEGGPRLLADLSATGRLDELCLTFAPRVVGGDAARIIAGAALDLSFGLAHLLEDDGTLLARYVHA